MPDAGDLCTAYRQLNRSENLLWAAQLARLISQHFFTDSTACFPRPVILFNILNFRSTFPSWRECFNSVVISIQLQWTTIFQRTHSSSYNPDGRILTLSLGNIHILIIIASLHIDAHSALLQYWVVYIYIFTKRVIKFLFSYIMTSVHRHLKYEQREAVHYCLTLCFWGFLLMTFYLDC